MSTKRVSVPGPVVLEGMLHEGDGSKGVVICHPHPLYGGSMHNNVVDALEEGFFAAGFTTLCFNFRGVGRSEGLHDEGIGEMDDVVAAASFVRATLSAGAPLVLAGYSFGAWVAARAAVRIDDVAALCLVAYPVAAYGADELRSVTRPVYFFAGSLDDIGPADGLMRVYDQLPVEKHVKVVPSSHFFPGWERAIAEFVIEHFS